MGQDEPRITIEISATAELNYAMVHNTIPLIQRISLTNPTADTIRNIAVHVELRPGISEPWTTRIEEIQPDATFHLNEVDLPLDRERLINMTERERAQLVVQASSDSGEHGRCIEDIEVLSYNEWSAATLPELLAAFVLPNHPVVAETLTHARRLLQARTGDPALNGYQSGDPQRVRAQAQAIYEALQHLDITYANPPASFETTGQKIRTPEQILSSRMGTCLDLTLFLAACMEQAGLYPMVFLIKGHAFPGVWITESNIPESTSDDGIRFRKLIALDAMLAFDSSAVATRPIVPFERALRIGVQHLQDADQFTMGLDVHAARSQRFLPLPARLDRRAFELVATTPAGTRAEDPEGRATRTKILARAKAAASAASPASPPKPPAPIIPRLEVWKKKLLDLTLRNRMLNFRETKQSVQIMCPNLPRFEDMLADGTVFQVQPKQAMLSSSDPRSRANLEARTQEDVEKEFLEEWMTKKVVHTNHSGDELAKRMVGIFRSARESLQETGSNTLCIALGFLSWYESDSSDKRRLAPLILLPASLERESAADAFQLSSSDDEARINTTLLEKLYNDHGLSIPELKNIPVDQSGVDVPQILGLFRHAIANFRRWEVVDRAYLGHFSFTKFLMWNDLQEKAESLLETEIVRHLALGANRVYPDQGRLVDASEVDTRYSPTDLLCPLDADSSQQSAILSASQGKTFVLQGPPGTGKSQTIANLIAHSLSEGKRVLFVSEKAAALDVVHRRLTQIGLAASCLELHSHKAKKRIVIEQLGKALHAERSAEPAEWAENAARLLQERDHLNGYSAALHAKRSLGISLFQGMSRLIGVRNVPRVDLSLGEVATSESYAALREATEGLSNAAAAVAPVANNPWKTTHPPKWETSTRERVETLLDRLRQDATNVAACALELGPLLQVQTTPRSLEGLRALADAGHLVTHARHAGAMLLDEPDWNAVQKAATSLVAVGRDRDMRKESLTPRYRDDLFNMKLPDLAVRVRRWSGAFFLLAWWMLRGTRKALGAVSREKKLAKNPVLLADLECAITVQQHDTTLTNSVSLGERIFGTRWMLPDRDWNEFDATIGWAGRFRASCAGLQSAGLTGPGTSPSSTLMQLTGSSSPATSVAASQLSGALSQLADTQSEIRTLIGVNEEATYGPVSDPSYLDRVLHSAREWANAISGLRDWHQYTIYRDRANKHGLRPIVDCFETGACTANQAVVAFDRAFYSGWTSRTISQDAVLREFYGEEHSRHIARFAKLDRTSLVTTQKLTTARTSARIPRAGARTADTSEMGLLMRELKKQRRHLPIRVLFKRIPNLLKVLKPCLLMSPLSVAQYLDPMGENFDLVVFDEASQIPTHDAIGALARGNKAIIVGDSKQLPPTSFFQASDNPDAEPDEEEFDELESILDECVAARVPQKSLDWHYRSRHESLIAFSNFHYYDNRLNTFPSAADQVAHLGVSWRLVPGFYDKGKSRTNRNEAQAVVADIVKRLLDPEESTRSIGVVTFSKAQQTLVEDLLDEARRQHPSIEKYFSDGQVLEPVIIKNLENIQGDERDVILFSICYGPDMHGKVAMNFGPLNRDGGERRLNVAITRAREQLIVFSTLRADQIDLSRTKSRGVSHLKTFLDYAHRGPKAIAEALTVDGEALFDSPFEEEVYDLLRERGWNVRTQIGCAGYRVDLGVVHPADAGRFVLGIECDGAYYHSAKSARDRDRLRGQVLESLGWQLYRIWSTDWWEDPKREIDKAEVVIRQALQNAKAAPRTQSNAIADEPPDQAGVPPEAVTRLSSAPAVAKDLSDSWSMPDEPFEAVAACVATSHSASAAQPAPAPAAKDVVYEVAQLTAAIRPSDACYEVSHESGLSDMLRTIVETEAPLSIKVLARRVAPYWSVKRATARFEKRLLAVMQKLPAADRPKVADGFVWRAGQWPEQFDKVRVPQAGQDASRRQASEIPIEEIANAAKQVLQENLALDISTLGRETARVFGISRMGGRVESRMRVGIERLAHLGVATLNGEQVTLK